MNATRSACRTFLGWLLPVMVGGASGCLVLFCILHRNDTTWMGMDAMARKLACGLAIFAAVAAEWLVLRQKRLLHQGQVTEAIVDEVRELSWSKDHSAAYYHFFTEDRRVIMSYCAVENDDKERFSPGQKIKAIYDPARPARHAIDDRTWAAKCKSAA
jgi:hypothetical protein